LRWLTLFALAGLAIFLVPNGEGQQKQDRAKKPRVKSQAKKKLPVVPSDPPIYDPAFEKVDAPLKMLLLAHSNGGLREATKTAAAAGLRLESNSISVELSAVDRTAALRLKAELEGFGEKNLVDLENRIWGQISLSSLRCILGTADLWSASVSRENIVPLNKTDNRKGH